MFLFSLGNGDNFGVEVKSIAEQPRLKELSLAGLLDGDLLNTGKSGVLGIVSSGMVTIGLLTGDEKDEGS